MRLHEILNETENKDQGIPGKVEPEYDAVSPGVSAFKQLRNTDPYMQYRMGVAMAVVDKPMDQESAQAENLVVAPYSDADAEIMKKAARIMGVTPTTVAKKKSSEPAGTNTASPVAAPKRNRYGV